ncbi:MAG: hypothetical protein GY863_02700, partial [bacterium]|nr:hypothetical protein [bacterium]
RFEYDLTADKGRQFMIYFMNGEFAWSQRNLLPRGHSDQLMMEAKRRLALCDGIAYFAENSDQLTWEEDADVEFKDGDTVTKTVPCYVVTSIIAQDTTQLFIDKDNYYFTQETYKTAQGRNKINTTRQYADFKRFGSATLASAVTEIFETRYGMMVRPFTLNEIKFNVDIPAETFTEDIPEK